MEILLQEGVRELYQLGFIASIVYIIFNLFNFGFKFYGSMFLDRNVKYVLSPAEKIGLLISFATIIGYLI
jgi:hypothetical protein